MEKNLKLTLLTFAVITLIFSIGLSYAFERNHYLVTKHNNLVQKYNSLIEDYNQLAKSVNTSHFDPETTANVHVIVENAMGTEAVHVGNTITDWGENLTRQVFYDARVYADNATLDNIAIGNHSSSITGSTVLASEGDRADVGVAGTNTTAWTNGGDYAINVTYKFVEPTFSCNATAIHTENTGGNAYAIATFNQQSGTYNITVTWTITYNGN